MNFEKFTVKAQEAVQKAIAIAQKGSRQSIEPEHLLAGVLAAGEDLNRYLLGKLGIQPRQLQADLDRALERLPKVSGGQPYLSGDSNKALERAQSESEKAGNEFTPIEYLLLGI